MPASEPSLADWDQWELKEKQPVFFLKKLTCDKTATLI